ncbi:DciA family protein [Salipiger sp. H15]|uniref:DciA family protein n=1 Tax=Alloyangia sp. H15 TaxID=3029062 RepID=A0AAU8AME6_9RHOB
MARRNTSTYGFAKTSGLLNAQIRKASESRGFAQSRLLTHWDEIVGADIAAMARPVEVSYARQQGLGATLTLLTTGANAPLLEMQKEQLREKVNAVYGYNAIARVRITQTAATGFAEGRVAFGHAPKAEKPEPSPEIKAEAHRVAEDIHDEGLRAALERLAGNVISKSRQ